MFREHLSEQRLGGAPPVDVGRVEEVDARLEGRLDACPRLLPLDAAGVGEPRAEADLRDLDLAPAEFAEVHAAQTTLYAWPQSIPICASHPSGSP